MARQWDGSVEEEAIQDYLPISVLSIITFLFALISAFAFYVPSIWPIGLLAIGLGFAAVIQCAYRPASLSWLAYVGVFVAVVSVTLSQVGQSMYQGKLLRTASEHGETWLQMIADNKINEAICLRMQYQDRPLDGVDLDEYFSRTVRPDATMSMMPAPAEMKKMFASRATIANLVSTGNKLAIRPVPEQDHLTRTDTGTVEISVYYDVDIMVDGRLETNVLHLQLLRTKLLGGIQWQIQDFENMTRPDASAMTAL